MELVTQMKDRKTQRELTRLYFKYCWHHSSRQTVLEPGQQLNRRPRSECPAENDRRRITETGAYSTRVRLCSRMNCWRYQYPPANLPVVPENFQPPNGWAWTSAPVVAL